MNNEIMAKYEELKILRKEMDAWKTKNEEIEILRLKAVKNLVTSGLKILKILMDKEASGVLKKEEIENRLKEFEEIGLNELIEEYKNTLK